MLTNPSTPSRKSTASTTSRIRICGVIWIIPLPEAMVERDPICNSVTAEQKLERNAAGLLKHDNAFRG
jgi:hypothetical protein